MAGVRLERIRDEIIALRPVYTERGDATEVYLRDGEVKVLAAGIRSVRRRFLQNYALDFNEQQKLLACEFGRKKLLPFYIDERVFIPLKMRKAVSKNDMVNGYVEVGEIADFRGEGASSCLITLSSGVEIHLTCEEETLIKSFHMGKRLKERLLREKAEKAVYSLSGDPLWALLAELGAVVKRKG